MSNNSAQNPSVNISSFSVFSETKTIFHPVAVKSLLYRLLKFVRPLCNALFLATGHCGLISYQTKREELLKSTKQAGLNIKNFLSGLEILLFYNIR